jgi:hypothetical protein
MYRCLPRGHRYPTPYGSLRRLVESSLSVVVFMGPFTVTGFVPVPAMLYGRY